MGKDGIQSERVVRCPKCGFKLRRTGSDDEHYRGLGIVVYDAHCDGCDTTVGIEDRSSFKQEGKIIITFT